MKTLIATLLAAAVSVSYAQAPDAKPDPAAYRNLTHKASADYKAAEKNCKSMSGNAKTVCIEEAKVARARTELDAVAQYNNTTRASIDSRTKLANAEFGLAKARCATSSGTEKDSCINNAKSVHTAALADAKLNVTSSTTASTAAPETSTSTADATKAAAVEKCAQVAGQPSTGCLIDNRSATTSTTSTTTTTPAAATTAGAIANRTENAAATAVDKTKAAAATVADKTERAVDTVAAKTERAADTVAAKSERAAEKTGAVVADSVITTKVKADIFKEPELKSMAIHVETEKGVVMLSGFVDSKADAEKAASIARSVEGVTQVKSAIKVK
jgi:hyperosmotically inducible periplasmic protein